MVSLLRVLGVARGQGRQPGEFNMPHGVKVGRNQVYVCDFHNNRIQVFDSELSFITFLALKALEKDSMIGLMT